MIIVGGIFNTRTAIAVVTEALAADAAIVIEPFRQGHDVTVMDYSEATSWFAQSSAHRLADAEWCENGRDGDVWVKPLGN